MALTLGFAAKKAIAAEYDFHERCPSSFVTEENYRDLSDCVLSETESYCSASDWEVLSDRNGIRVERFSQDDSELPVYRFSYKSFVRWKSGVRIDGVGSGLVTVLNYSPGIYVNSVAPSHDHTLYLYRPIWDADFSRGRVVQPLTDKKTWKNFGIAARVEYIVYESRWWASARDFCILRATQSKSDGSFVIGACSVKHRDAQLKPRMTRGLVHAHGFVIEPVSGQPNSCVVTCVSQVEMLGWLPEILGMAKQIQHVQERYPTLETRVEMEIKELVRVNIAEDEEESVPKDEESALETNRDEVAAETASESNAKEAKKEVKSAMAGRKDSGARAEGSEASGESKPSRVQFRDLMEGTGEAQRGNVPSAQQEGEDEEEEETESTELDPTNPLYKTEIYWFNRHLRRKSPSLAEEDKKKAVLSYWDQQLLQFAERRFGVGTGVEAIGAAKPLGYDTDDTESYISNGSDTDDEQDDVEESDQIVPSSNARQLRRSVSMSVEKARQSVDEQKLVQPMFAPTARMSLREYTQQQKNMLKNLDVKAAMEQRLLQRSKAREYKKIKGMQPWEQERMRKRVASGLSRSELKKRYTDIVNALLQARYDEGSRFPLAVIVLPNHHRRVNDPHCWKWTNPRYWSDDPERPTLSLYPLCNSAFGWRIPEGAQGIPLPDTLSVIDRIAPFLFLLYQTYGLPLLDSIPLAALPYPKRGKEHKKASKKFIKCQQFNAARGLKKLLAHFGPFTDPVLDDEATAVQEVAAALMELEDVLDDAEQRGFRADQLIVPYPSEYGQTLWLSEDTLQYYIENEDGTVSVNEEEVQRFLQERSKKGKKKAEKSAKPSLIRSTSVFYDPANPEADHV